MVDAPITCKLLSHSMACHPPAVNKKKKISETGPNWASNYYQHRQTEITSLVEPWIVPNSAISAAGNAINGSRP